MAEKDFWRNRLHADDRERVLAAYRNPAAGDEIVLEYRWLCRDGNYKWFYDRTIKKHTPQGMQYFGIILDISERKQAEAEKRILEERLQWAEKMEAIGTLGRRHRPRLQQSAYGNPRLCVHGVNESRSMPIPIMNGSNGLRSRCKVGPI